MGSAVPWVVWNCSDRRVKDGELVVVGGDEGKDEEWWRECRSCWGSDEAERIVCWAVALLSERARSKLGCGYLFGRWRLVEW